VCDGTRSRQYVNLEKIIALIDTDLAWMVSTRLHQPARDLRLLRARFRQQVKAAMATRKCERAHGTPSAMPPCAVVRRVGMWLAGWLAGWRHWLTD
jgi:hypothetical protein